MADYLNKEIPVADGELVGVAPNTSLLYPWMSVKAGATSYFGEIQMRGDLYDKNGKLITGSEDITANGKNLMFYEGGTGQTDLTTLNEKIEIVFSGGEVTYYNTSNADQTCIGIGDFQWQINSEAPVMINVCFDFKVITSTSTPVTFTFQVDTAPEDALGRTKVFLPPPGQSINIAVQFLEPAWKAGGYLGRFYITNDASASVSLILENAQAYSEIQAPSVP